MPTVWLSPTRSRSCGCRPATTAPSIVDNSDAAFSETGSGWQGYSDPSAYGGDERYCQAGTGQNTAQWTFANLDPTAQYQVYATWTASYNRATDAPYSISDSGNLLATVDMNQQFAPTDATIDGQGWQSLGVYTASSGTLTVGLSDNANGVVVANAIRIVQVEPATTAPSVVEYGRRRFLRDGQRLAGLQRPVGLRRRRARLPGGHRPEHGPMDLRQRRSDRPIPGVCHMDGIL